VRARVDEVRAIGIASVECGVVDHRENQMGRGTEWLACCAHREPQCTGRDPVETHQKVSLPHEITDGEPGLGPWAILHGYRGSVAHGMYEPPENPLSIDDKDTMAICVPPLEYYYGLSEYGSRGTREIKRGEWDRTKSSSSAPVRPRPSAILSLRRQVAHAGPRTS
jgi:hypothetical protein